MGILRVSRATTAERLGVTPSTGELIYDEDLVSIWFGDGLTAGGLPLLSSIDVIRTPNSTPTNFTVSDTGGIVRPSDSTSLGGYLKNLSDINRIWVSFAGPAVAGISDPLLPGAELSFTQGGIVVFSGDVYVITEAGLTADILVVSLTP